MCLDVCVCVLWVPMHVRARCALALAFVWQHMIYCPYVLIKLFQQRDPVKKKKERERGQRERGRDSEGKEGKRYRTVRTNYTSDRRGQEAGTAVEMNTAGNTSAENKEARRQRWDGGVSGGEFEEAGGGDVNLCNSAPSSMPWILPVHLCVCVCLCLFVCVQPVGLQPHQLHRRWSVPSFTWPGSSVSTAVLTCLLWPVVQQLLFTLSFKNCIIH